MDCTNGDDALARLPRTRKDMEPPSAAAPCDEDMSDASLWVLRMPLGPMLALALNIPP